MASSKDTTPSMVGALLLAGISLLPNSAKATNDDEHDSSRWGLGLGGAFSHSPYRGMDNQNQALPIVSYENRWVSLLGPGLDIKIPSTTALSLRLQARYGLGDGYDASDSDDLAGMHDRDPGVWLGGSAIWASPFAQFSAQWLGDVSGNSDGQTFKLAVERRFRANAFDFTPRLAAVRVNDRYVDYYYGVRASEANAVRNAYDGEATVNLEAGLRTGYALDEHQHLYLDLSVTRLGDDIKDSPIVDRSTLSSARFWYLYRF